MYCQKNTGFIVIGLMSYNLGGYKEDFWDALEPVNFMPPRFLNLQLLFIKLKSIWFGGCFYFCDFSSNKLIDFGRFGSSLKILTTDSIKLNPVFLIPSELSFSILLLKNEHSICSSTSNSFSSKNLSVSLVYLTFSSIFILITCSWTYYSFFRFFYIGLLYLSFEKIGRFWNRPLTICYYVD